MMHALENIVIVLILQRECPLKSKSSCLEYQTVLYVIASLAPSVSNNPCSNKYYDNMTSSYAKLSRQLGNKPSIHISNNLISYLFYM